MRCDRESSRLASANRLKPTEKSGELLFFIGWFQCRYTSSRVARLINAVSKTGGHLGAGLGVVELTVALHHVFDTPRDRLVWDVGHQSYPHKILTGRRDRIRTIRQGGGLSGFTKRAESEYDPFGAAHASTSISAGLGM